jgi:hypothetical protein
MPAPENHSTSMHLQGMTPAAIACVAECPVAEIRRIATAAGVTLPVDDGAPLPGYVVQRVLNAIDIGREWWIICR